MQPTLYFKFLLPVALMILGLCAGQAAVAQGCGIIVTIAGNGYGAGTPTGGFSGDGGPATAAELYGPTGVAIDGIGNVYIADASNERIRKVTMAGNISTVAGTDTFGFSGDGSPATAAELNAPQGIAVDASGNLYIADVGNDRIRKVNTFGIISTFAGNGTHGAAGDGGPATAAELNGPIGIAVDGMGNVYIADYVNNKVRKVNPAGIISTVAGNGTAGFSGDGGPATAAQLNVPVAVTIDGSGNLFIVDQGDNRVHKVAPTGIINTFAGNGTVGFSGDGGAATVAQLDVPAGVAADADGNIYIVEVDDFRVRKVNPSGIISTFAGSGTRGYSGDGGPATAADFFNADGVAVDGGGNLYIVDGNNNVIRKVGACTTGTPIMKSPADVSDIKVYPNPSRGILSAVLPQHIADAIFTLTDITGRVIKTETTSETKLNFNLSRNASGLYLLKVECEGNTFVKKVVIE